MTVLPDGWKLAELNDLQSEEPRAITDGPFGSNLARAHYTASGPRVVRLQNIGDGVFNDARAHISQAHFETLRTHEVLPGDLLIASLGEVLPRACLAPASLGPAIVKADCIRVRLSRDVDLRWVMYSLQRPQVRRWADDHRHGVGRPRLGLKVIRQIPVPLPPLDEQRRIVEILEDHLSRLDAASQLFDTTRLRLRALGQSLWSRHFGRQQGVVEPLLSLVEIANGQTPKGLLDALVSEVSDSVVPFFKVGDMNQSDGRLMASTRSYVQVADARSLGLHLRPAGTVLFPKRGGAIATNKKRLLNAEAAYDLNIMGLVPGPRIRPSYLWHWLEGIDLAGLADGSNVPQINGPQIRGLSLVAPPLEEQDRLVSVMDSNDEATGLLGSKIDHARARSERLRQALLAAAFSGRLTDRSTDMEIVEEMAGV